MVGTASDAEEHQDTLEEVSPANSEKAACKRVRNNDYCTDQQRHHVRDAEYGREELRAGYEAGRRVEQEEHQNKERRNDRDPAGLVVEAVLEELRQRDGVVLRSWYTGADGFATSSQLR